MGSRPATLIVTGSSDGASELASVASEEVSAAGDDSSGDAGAAVSELSAASEVVAAALVVVDPESAVELHAASPPRARTPAVDNAVMRVNLIVTPL